MLNQVRARRPVAYVLDVQQEQLTYVARFSRPLFEVWGDGKTIVRSLFEAFSQFGVPLSNIRLEPGMTNATDPVVNVNIGSGGNHKFMFDRTETVFAYLTEDSIKSIPSLLEASTRWIRATSPSLKFASHQFVYFNHGHLKNASVEEFLKSVGPKSPKTGGVNKGNGAIFHWEVPDRKWSTQLVLDRSLVIPGGLYTMLTLLVFGDIVNYPELLGEGRAYLGAVLGELGLNFPELVA